MIEEVTPKDLSERLQSGEEIFIVDVREPDELEICRIAESLHVPLGEISSRQGEFDPDKRYAFLCHHGMRSASAAGYLAEQGLENLINISGGIDRWALEVEPSMDRY